MRYADVALLTKLKNSKDTLTYTIPDSLTLCVGDFVIVPLRNAQTKACVLSIHSNKPQYATKEVLSKLENELPLPQHYLEMLSYISEQTLYSINNLFATWISVANEQKSKRANEQIKKSINQEINKSINTSNLNSTNRPHRPRLSLYSSKQELNKILHSIIDSYAGQVVIVFPQVHQIQDFVSTLSLDRRIYSSHKKLSVKQQYEQWQAAHSDLTGVFIGNRSLLSLPFAQPAHIILVDDIADEHIQREPTPHYTTHQVAKFYESFTQVTYLSYFPRIENLHRVTHKEMDFIPSHDTPHENISTSYINSHTTSQNSSFTNEVLESIQNCIIEKKQVLIFCNKKGLFTGIFCRDCKKSHKDINVLKCPFCRSVNLMPTGIGILQLQEELHSKFPEATISTYSQDGKKEFAADIIIATESILPFLSTLKTSLIVISSLDSLLFNQRSIQDEMHLLTIFTQFLLTDATLVIQAQQEIPQALQNVLSKNFKDWYLKKIAERKNYKLSPFYNHIEITYFNKNNAQGAIEIQDIHSRIKKQLPKNCELTDLIQTENLWSFEIITPIDFNNAELSFIKDFPIKIYSLS